jgi:hypothetical protein
MLNEEPLACGIQFQENVFAIRGHAKVGGGIGKPELAT